MPPSVRAVAFDAATWREVGPRMLELERAEWGPRAFSQTEMRWQATNPDAVVMTTWDGPTLIGFAVAASEQLFNETSPSKLVWIC